MIEFLNGCAEVWGALREHFPVLPLLLTVWTSAPLVAYACMQAIKLWRAGCGARKLRKHEVRTVAGIIAAAWALRAAIVWHDEPLESAAMHAILIGFATPYVVAAVFWWLNRRDAKLAEVMTVRSVRPRRRAGDAFDPNDDTGEFRL